ncbi:MAG: hypothetical protein NZ455_01280 [Bacteroidia bacterium]|nr:hypothetical protein [Bacteroidia bacterium]
MSAGSGIAFMALSLIDVEKRKSYSISQEQIIVSQVDKVKLRKKKRNGVVRRGVKMRLKLNPIRLLIMLSRCC